MSASDSSSPKKRQRANGKGSLFFDSNRRRWIVRYYALSPTGKKYRQTRTFHTEEDGRVYLERVGAGWPAYHKLEIPPLSEMPSDCYIYFVQSVNGGPIKIGSTRNLRQRFTNLQGSSPVILRLLHTMVGDKTIEQKLHRKFKSYRLWGEWFVPAEPVVRCVERLRRLGGETP